MQGLIFEEEDSLEGHFAPLGGWVFLVEEGRVFLGELGWLLGVRTIDS